VGVFAVFLARGLAVLAFGLAAGVFLVAGAFFAVLALVAVFLGAAFLAVGAGEDALGFASFGSFYLSVSDARDRWRTSFDHAP
jgi:hypothetical protein